MSLKKTPIAGMIIAVGCLLIAETGFSPAFGQAFVSSPISARPLCGIHSVYAALRYVGVNLELADLMSSKYLDRDDGSTISQLMRAVVDRGAFAHALRGLTPSDLVNESMPAILHIRSDSSSLRPDHFVVCLGNAGKQRVWIYDAPESPRIWTYDEIASVWSGDALLISKSSIPSMTQHQRLPWMLFLYVGIAIVGAGSGHVALCRMMQGDGTFHRRLATALQVATIVAVSAGCAMFDLVASDSNALRSQEIASAVAEERMPSRKIDEISIEEVKCDSECHKLILVDARQPRDYALGRIRDARNVPVNSSAAMRHVLMRDIGQDVPVAVYCQSEGCSYAQIIARRLLSDGYTNVRVLRAGWVGWKSHMGDYQGKDHHL